MSERTTATSVFEDLAGGILSGTRAPGTPLPACRELAKARGIAPGTANDALARLVEVGLAVRTGRAREVAPVPSGTRALRSAVRGLVDDAIRTSTDLETLLLLVRGLWGQREIRAHETIDDDRYAERVPAELVLGGAPEPECDEVAPDNRIRAALAAQIQSEDMAESEPETSGEPEGHDVADLEVDEDEGDRDDVAVNGSDQGDEDEDSWGDVQRQSAWDETTTGRTMRTRSRQLISRAMTRPSRGNAKSSSVSPVRPCTADMFSHRQKPTSMRTRAPARKGGAVLRGR